ncbi:MXAN_6640 family putative metalloprotease [Nocardioides sp.]|uniref:MXAN_6640 family putative metalloprotease n=1 Tax=Nocardioides sp. TaxID=35761 RepID=UPI003783119B
MAPRTRRGRALVAAITVPLIIAAGLTATGPASAADPGGKSAPPRAAEARAALADAQALLDGHAPVTDGPSSRDATMTLLRLAQLRSSLTGADRAAAARILARPGTTHAACSASNCYHWSSSGGDAVPSTDNDADGIPDYVEQVAATVDGVRNTYLGAGYRAPKPDGSVGGNSQTDIYLADVGSDGLYGYCTSDESIPNPPPAYDAWAFCVLDNDYSASQFPTNTPLENLQVTAAHEYFHAVQFAYDAFEDSWFMEATATWAEDELFDDVNDNLQYLVDSPLAKPGQPLDTFSSGAGPQYGEWIYFRFLTENMPASDGGLPTIIRGMWERADGAAGGPDDYSMQAVQNALADRGVSMTGAFTSFAAANRVPALSYSEGAANDYPTAPPDGIFKLSTSKKDSGWKYAKLLHLAAATARFVPGSGLSAAKWKLKVSVDLPPKNTNTTAVVTVVKKSGDPQQVVIPLSGSGNGSRKVAFGSSGVRYVEVTLVNAGARYNCWNGGDYSCHGSSLDDGRKLQVRAQVTT